MIARVWRGSTRAEDADRYLDYLRRTGLGDYAATEGNRGYQVLCRRAGGRADFVLISFWDSYGAIERFVGADIDTAVFYPDDDLFLIDRDLTVTHFEVLGEFRSDRAAEAAPRARPTLRAPDQDGGTTL